MDGSLSLRGISNHFIKIIPVAKVSALFILGNFSCGDFSAKHFDGDILTLLWLLKTIITLKQEFNYMNFMLLHRVVSRDAFASFALATISTFRRSR